MCVFRFPLTAASRGHVSLALCSCHCRRALPLSCFTVSKAVSCLVVLPFVPCLSAQHDLTPALLFGGSCAFCI